MTASQRRIPLSCHRIRSPPLARGHKIRVISAQIEFLGGTGATVQATLSRLIRDPEPRVRAACLRASMDLETPGFEAAAWLDDPDHGVALAAAEALAGRGSEEATVDLLTSAVFLHDGVNRQAVACLLRRLDPPRANAALITVLQDDDQRRSWRVAIEVLEVLNRPDTPSALP